MLPSKSHLFTHVISFAKRTREEQKKKAQAETKTKLIDKWYFISIDCNDMNELLKAKVMNVLYHVLMLQHLSDYRLLLHSLHTIAHSTKIVYVKQGRNKIKKTKSKQDDDDDEIQ